MIEVKMKLYDEAEMAFFNQFFAALQQVRRYGNGPKTASESEQVAQDVKQESQQAYGVSEAEHSVETQQIVNAAVAANVDIAAAISAFKAYAEKNGIPAARAALDKVGVKRAGDITEAQVPALLEAIK